MSRSIEQQQHFRESLIAELRGNTDVILDEWMLRAQACHPFESQSNETMFRAEAAEFLQRLITALQQDDTVAVGNQAESEAILQRYFPQLYSLPNIFLLSEILVERLHVSAPAIPAYAIVAGIRLGISAITVPDIPDTLYNERLAQLSQLSWRLNGLRDQDAIFQTTLVEASALVGAASSAIWLWDMDQQMPLLMISTTTQMMGIMTPPRLLQFLRQASENSCAFSIDGGEGDEAWPEELRDRPIAFIPLPTQEGCLGILTVHHLPGGRFTHDDILLLSSLGNLVATAVRNVQLYTSERHLVNLLQTSIRQVVDATAQGSSAHDEFVQSLLHVAEGLTRADAISVRLHIDEQLPPLEMISGSSSPPVRATIVKVADRLFATYTGDDSAEIRETGKVHDLIPDYVAADVRMTYAVSPIKLTGKIRGVIVALRETAFPDDQVALLRTMAEQIGIGVHNRQQSANMQRLLIELSNVNYVSDTVASTFDPQRIFHTVSLAASQALNVPIALCGWLEDDGAIRVLPDTTIGIPPELVVQLGLTYNNSVIRTVLDQRVEVTSVSYGKRAVTAFPFLRLLHGRDWMCVPMMVKPRARGIMLVADVRSRRFSNHEIALLSTYANQAALAMENSLLYDQVDNQLRQMELLYHVTRSVSSTLDRDTIFRELLQAATAALQVPAAIICLLDAETKQQTVAATTGIGDSIGQGMTIAGEEGIIGMVGQRGEPVISSHLARDGRSPLLRNLARTENFVSAMAVPMLAQGKVCGTITVISREARDFTAAHMQLLQALATEAAVAVQNAKLYEQERERARSLRTLIGETSNRVTTVFEFLKDLLAVSQQSESGDEGIRRMQYRIGCLAAIQAVVSEDTPGVADVKEAVTLFMRQRMVELEQQGRVVPITVTGAHVILPLRLAMGLAILVHEWVQPYLEQAAIPPNGRITVSFQQFGREILVQLEATTCGEERQVAGNHAIISLVTEMLPGALSEQHDATAHRLRYRFTSVYEPVGA